MTDATRTAAAKKTAAAAKKKPTTPRKPRTTKPGAKSAAATREATGQAAPALKIHGVTLTLPAELPFSMMRHAAAMETGTLGVSATITLLEDLLGKEQMDTVWAAGLTLQQGNELVAAVMEAIGLTLGESPASPTS